MQRFCTRPMSWDQEMTIIQLYFFCLAASFGLWLYQSYIKVSLFICLYPFFFRGVFHWKRSYCVGGCVVQSSAPRWRCLHGEKLKWRRKKSPETAFCEHAVRPAFPTEQRKGTWWGTLTLRLTAKFWSLRAAETRLFRAICVHKLLGYLLVRMLTGRLLPE